MRDQNKSLPHNQFFKKILLAFFAHQGRKGLPWSGIGLSKKDQTLCVFPTNDKKDPIVGQRGKKVCSSKEKAPQAHYNQALVCFIK